MNKLISVVGPTASGKSDLAVEIAREIGGEVVSADSRQVYRGLDIGSGKITTGEMQGVPHHMLDVADPKDVYSVAQYQKDAQHVLEAIWSRGKIPILCGGTGQYVEAVIDGIVFPEVPPNESLRSELETLSLEELQNKLQALDPKRFETIDKDNPARLVRAIEIASALGEVPVLQKTKQDFEVLMIGIKTEKETLVQRIHDRLHARMENGMLEEVQSLHANGLSFKRLEALGLEYRYIAQHLQGMLEKEAMLEKLETEIRRYAKRQMTWFKRDERIKWFALEEREEVLRLCTNFV